MSGDPYVCGDSRRSDVLAESTCIHCDQPIYRTNRWYGWRHPDGFVICVVNFAGRGHPDNTKAEPHTEDE